jgi:hypothetical protein
MSKDGNRPAETAAHLSRRTAVRGKLLDANRLAIDV